MNKIEQLNQISIRNLKQNGGTLGFSYEEMLEILHKHNISSITKILSLDDEPIGYILYYFKDEHTIHISHICLDTKYQGKQLGDVLLNAIRKNYQHYNITADVYYDNKKSHSFFLRNGFDMEEESAKQRWNCILYGEEIR